MRKVRQPKDMTPSTRPWAWGIVPSGKHAVVKGYNGEVVCICHPANAREICGGINPIEDIYAYGTGAEKKLKYPLVNENEIWYNIVS